MTPDTSFPDIRDLLPHRGPAVLLGRVLSHDPKQTVCAVDAGAGASFRDDDGGMPAYVALEMMAQAVAAHGGLLEWSRRSASGDEAVVRRPGFFVGTRRLVFSTDRFAPGQSLDVSAVHLRGASGLLAFDCSVTDAATGAAMVSGVLTVYLLESFEALVEDFSADD
jgi:predicted hotdog family 3-hydroxylacyl-ACP dehydratase